MLYAVYGACILHMVGPTRKSNTTTLSLSLKPGKTLVIDKNITLLTTPLR